MQENNINVSDKIVMMDIADIKPYNNNPRIHDKTVDLLVEIIPKVGFNVPLVIDKNNVIVKGHARYEAAQRLGMQKLPCIISEASDEANRADRITDNRVSEFSEWVNEELLHELDMIDIDVDFDALGLPKPAYDDMPEFDDFEDDVDEFSPMSDEEKQKMYEEFLDRQAKENAESVQIATQRDIDNAREKQSEVAKEPPRYLKVTCEECGKVFFVREGDAYEY